MQPTTEKITVRKNTDTTGAGIVASTQPSVQTAQENYNQVQQATGTQAQDAQSALQRMAENIFGQKATAQSNQVNLENQAGIQQEQKALGELNTEIASQQASLNVELDNIRRVPGQTQAQLQSSINAVNDTYSRRLANLGIRQAAATNNITAIQSNAERQTKLLTAPLDTKILYLSTFGKDNVDFLTKEQQNKLAFISDDLKTQKQDIQALQKLKTDFTTEIAQNGGGTNTQLIARLQAAKTPEEANAIAASSGYIGKIDRRYKEAQISKIYQDIAESRAKEDVKKKGLVLTPITAAQAQNKVQQITDLTNNRGIQTSVGTSVFSKAASSIPGKIFKAIFSPGGSAKDLGASLTGARQDYIANVDQLSSQLSIDSLISAKANGVTFGALTEKELELLSNSASKINKWAIRDDNGKVVGYNTSEKSFKAELDKINNYAKLDYIYRGGNGADVGVFQLQDGTYATKNSDGTVEILELIQ